MACNFCSGFSAAGHCVLDDLQVPAVCGHSGHHHCSGLLQRISKTHLTLVLGRPDWVPMYLVFRHHLSASGILPSDGLVGTHLMAGSMKPPLSAQQHMQVIGICCEQHSQQAVGSASLCYRACWLVRSQKMRKSCICCHALFDAGKYLLAQSKAAKMVCFQVTL